jgi:hypothetical protein
MSHVVLLGDSIFDNGAYVAGGPDVVTQLEGILPRPWRATLLAVDGAVVADVGRQLARIPSDATRLVLSVGGNDSLRHLDVLDRPSRSTGEVLDLLAGIATGFAEQYGGLLRQVLARGVPTTVCTIYEGALPDPALHRRARVALHAFNDPILRAALEHGLSLIDLRLVCDEPGDYANPIEPSVRGGAKIARAIAAAVGASESGRRSQLFW